jgi:hypothetical protein
MNDLSNTIYSYYLAHFAELTTEKQFHFAARLQLWCQDPAAPDLLAQLRSQVLDNGDALATLKGIIQAAEQSPSHGSKNATELRQPYFDRYPMLKTYVLVLFRITFLLHMYQVDAHELFFSLFPRQQVDDLEQQLLKDKGAISILSTHAINFLYLYERIIKQQEASLPVDQFLTVGQQSYDLSNVLHLQLLIYLYTHCIIGESLFYFRRLPSKDLALYQAMLASLESLIAAHFKDINLDNKFEFLVCAKILGQTSRLEGQIFAEAHASVSAQGSFLIDKLNGNPQRGNITLEASEHRNVLFILANRDYSPLC